MPRLKLYDHETERDSVRVAKSRNRVERNDVWGCRPESTEAEHSLPLSSLTPHTPRAILRASPTILYTEHDDESESTDPTSHSESEFVRRLSAGPQNWFRLELEFGFCDSESGRSKSLSLTGLGTLVASGLRVPEAEGRPKSQPEQPERR
eukprot:3241290-Rhodomonas_salina.3